MMFEFPKSVMVAGHKYLTPDGVVYPSVTTILGSTKPPEAVNGLKTWRESVGEGVADYITREAAYVGTQAHELNEAFLVMRDAGPLPDRDFIHSDGRTPLLLAWAHYQNFRPHLDRIHNIHGTEIILHSDTLRVAGTADCIGEYDGVLSIIDYKTKRSPQRDEWISDYYAQAAAYAMMYYELTGVDVRQAVILASSEKNTMQVFRADINKHTNAFLERLSTYDVRCRTEEHKAWLEEYGDLVE